MSLSPLRAQFASARRSLLGARQSADNDIHGFFGSHTGTIIIALPASKMDLEFLSATAPAQLINLTPNAGAIAYFIMRGNVDYGLTLPLARLTSWADCALRSSP